MSLYAEGWTVIVDALVKRLESLPLIGHVYPNIIYIPEGADSSEWQEKFMRVDDQGRDEVNTWMVNRSSGPIERNSKDNPVQYTRRHMVDVMGHMQFRGEESWAPWHQLLDQIIDELRNGDRTMGQVCLTNSVPDQSDSMYSDWCGVMTLSSKMSFWIEEAE